MHEPQIHSVTSARSSLSADQAIRNRRYLQSMAIRVVCFIGCILVDGWLRWALFVGALVLPWLAVVIANAGKEQRSRLTTSVVKGPNELE